VRQFPASGRRGSLVLNPSVPHESQPVALAVTLRCKVISVQRYLLVVELLTFAEIGMMSP
jgi:hypothetical protein